MSDLAIEIQGLTKSYGPKQALSGLNLSVPRGALAGFVGLNGAGKTTTLRILLRMARADSGAAKMLGLDISNSLAIRQRAAFIPEKKDLFPICGWARQSPSPNRFIPNGAAIWNRNSPKPSNWITGKEFRKSPRAR